jgi:hypothetical protein
MSVLVGNPFFLGAGASAGGGGYQIERSLRFNTPDNSFLSRTPASAGNKKTWTWAGWVKRSRPTFDTDYLIGCYFGGSLRYEYLAFTPSDSLDWFSGLYTTGGSTTTSGRRITTAVYRDTSAWYHIVLAKDTTQATAANRVKLYVNGVEVTTFSTSTDPAQNDESFINATDPHRIGSLVTTTGFYGYLADVHFIDGQALTPSDFTEVSATTGQLIPKEYTGTFGTNGFWLKFSDNSAATATTLGKDYSGNSNNWTPNNLSVTAGAGNDSLVDTPTSYGTDTGAGGEVRGNYATLNPINKNSGLNLLNGNLDATWSSGSALGASATIALPTSGKWYCEITNTGSSGIGYGIGISDSGRQTFTNSGILWAESAGSYYRSNGDIGCDGKATQTGSTYATGDIISIAYDAATRKIWFAKNGTWQLSGNPASGTNEIGTLNSPTGNYFFGFAIYDTNTGTANFGQRPFAYTAPSGFKALCDTNLPAPVVAKPSEVMDVKLYTGNGSTQTISGLGFSPDFLWFKARSIAYSHALYDTVRGYTKSLVSNSTVAEGTEAGGLSAFNSDGFSLNGENTVYGSTNTNGQTYVAWAWDAGSSTVTNTQGSITSQVRANASAGFSIVTYTGTGGTGTVGHGLGVTPSMIIVKNRSNSINWAVAHAGLSSNRCLNLNTTSDDSTVGFLGLDKSSFTSTTFTVNYSDTNTTVVNGSSNNYVAYCFAPVTGYSSFGSYTGNSSTDGPFVFCNFRPRWILIKQVTSSGDGWYIYDAQRIGYNPTNLYLWANGSNEEQTSGNFDLLSNGFKLRTTASALNYTGYTYIYAAFAESPFQYARAR